MKKPLKCPICETTNVRASGLATIDVTNDMPYQPMVCENGHHWPMYFDD